jgi:predicted Rossmann fold nucleotide-binding protein DprA/Smf involved in DNA uptake
MNLTPDTQAVLLLCSGLGQKGGNGSETLTVRQYAALAKWLKEQELRPGDLLDEKGRNALRRLDLASVNPISVERLLQRGGALAIAVERWFNRGLWVISRSDSAYPPSYKAYFGHEAPPLLYGVGNASLLSTGGLAIVGSRNASEEDLSFARTVGKACGVQKVTVVSGGARGIDLDAMVAAYNEGGTAVGVLPDGLAKAAVGPRYREAIIEDRLALISIAEPDARWFAHTAMQRNKLVYGLSNAAVVVASGREQGGTWAGATEALRAGRIPVYVKASGNLADGNSKLLGMGGRPLPESALQDIRSLFSGVAVSPDLFAASTRAASVVASLAPAEEQVAKLAAAPAPEQTISPEVAKGARTDAYSLVILEILHLVREEPRRRDWLAEELDVQRKQMEGWLKRAVKEGRLRKLNKPVRYAPASTAPNQESLPLFDIRGR